MPPPAYQHVIDNRIQYGTLIHLRGDSRPRGVLLGKFEDDPVDPLDPAHPLYAFRSPASIANWALEHNGRPERFVYAGSMDAEDIAYRIAQGTVRPGDSVVLMDAGFVTSPLSTYYQWLKDCRAAVAGAGVHCVMLTTPDYLAPGQHEPAQFDLVRSNGAGDSGTLNDMWRKAATWGADAVAASGSLSYAGKTSFIDLNAIMDSKRTSALAADGVDLFCNDRIHENVWGGMRMVQQIMAACGLREHIADVTPLQDLAAANWQFLGYGSMDPDWNANRARTYTAMLRRSL